MISTRYFESYLIFFNKKNFEDDKKKLSKIKFL